MLPDPGGGGRAQPGPQPGPQHSQVESDGPRVVEQGQGAGQVGPAGGQGEGDQAQRVNNLDS